MPNLMDFSLSPSLASAVPSVSSLLDLWKRRHLTRGVLRVVKECRFKRFLKVPALARTWENPGRTVFDSVCPSVSVSSSGIAAVAEFLEDFHGLRDEGTVEESQRVTASRQADQYGSRSLPSGFA